MIMKNKNNDHTNVADLNSENLSESDRISAFTETPSARRFEDSQKEKYEIIASDLFSLFTADILKSETIFTR